MLPPSPLAPESPPTSLLTYRIFPDTPEVSSLQSFYSAISSPLREKEEELKPSSPAGSTLSVQFLDDISPPRPRYFTPGKFIEQIPTFLLHFGLISPGEYFISPREINLDRLRKVVVNSFPDFTIYVFLPKYLFPFIVPIFTGCILSPQPSLQNL